MIAIIIVIIVIIIIIIIILAFSEAGKEPDSALIRKAVLHATFSHFILYPILFYYVWPISTLDLTFLVPHNFSTPPPPHPLCCAPHHVDQHVAHLGPP